MAKIQKNRLLTPSQRTACMRVTLKDAPFSERAHALLEIDKGSTQAAAAELSGLSIGQVKYWVARFRELGLDIFPVTLRKASVENEVAEEETKKAASEPKEKKSKSKKSKKDKSGKKGKKKKSDKKAKGKKKKSGKSKKGKKK